MVNPALPRGIGPPRLPLSGPCLDAQGCLPVCPSLCKPLFVTLKYHFQCSSRRENCAAVDPYNFEIYISFFSFFKKITLHHARKQLGTLGGAKIFKTLAHSFKLCPTHFSRGGNIFQGGRSLLCDPLGTGLLLTTAV